MDSYTQWVVVVEILPLKQWKGLNSVRKCHMDIYMISTVWYSFRCFRYDPMSKKWTFVTSMPTARHDAGGAVFNNELFVIGGYDGSSELNVVESYCRFSGKWRQCAPTNVARKWPGVIKLNLDFIFVLIINILLYLYHSRWLLRVALYTPSEDLWTDI